MLEKKIEMEYIYLLRDLQQLKAVELTNGDDRYFCRMVEISFTALFTGLP